MTDQLDIIETATAQGVATVMVPGYAAKRAAQRQRELPRQIPEKPNLDAWKRMAADFPGVVVPDTEGPIH